MILPIPLDDYANILQASMHSCCNTSLAAVTYSIVNTSCMYATCSFILRTAAKEDMLGAVNVEGLVNLVTCFSG